MRSIRWMLVAVTVGAALLCATACSNPNDAFREVGTQFTQEVINKDAAAMNELSAPNAFGQGTAGAEALANRLEEQCGPIVDFEEQSLDTGPSVEYDATSTMIFAINGQKQCTLRLTLILDEDQAMVRRAAVELAEE